MLKEKDYDYLFGPVPSRRLGRSLGVNLVPKKICSYDCVYCEVGSTVITTVERKEYIELQKLLSEIEEFTARNREIDVITLTGAGEPTLNSCIGSLIKAIKKIITDIPVAVLTNGSLLYLQDVKESLLDADIVIPSVDSVNEKDFFMVDKPDRHISLGKVLTGIKEFSYLYKGKLWLEILMVKDFNDSSESIKKLGMWASTVRADKLQLGTIIRPPVKNVSPVSFEQLKRIKRSLESFLSYPVEITGEFESESKCERISQNALLSSCNMRPLTKDDIIDIYGRSDDLDDTIFELLREGKLQERNFGNKRFFVASK